MHAPPYISFAVQLHVCRMLYDCSPEKHIGKNPEQFCANALKTNKQLIDNNSRIVKPNLQSFARFIRHSLLRVSSRAGPQDTHMKRDRDPKDYPPTRLDSIQPVGIVLSVPHADDTCQEVCAHDNKPTTLNEYLLMRPGSFPPRKPMNLRHIPTTVMADLL
jgi:hypothetical protein